MARMNQGWVLKQRPEHEVRSSDLELVETPVAPLGPGQILVKNIYLSIDPTNRVWLSSRDQYLPPVGIGDVVRGVTIGIVEDSSSERFSPGETVLLGQGGWQRYSTYDASAASRIRRRENIPLTASLSVLGTTGLTAYTGFLDICRPNPGETLVVSAAAGAVGSIVGQIAKIKGCRVIGIAGGPDKCKWISDELGFDGAIDYKSEDVGEALDRLCPDGVDMDFENVGGAIMDAVYSRMNVNGRMAVCGLISAYNSDGPMAGPTDFGRVLMNRLTIQGFVILDHFSRAREAYGDLAAWIQSGQLRWKDHVIAGLDSAPEAMNRLFTGDHDGKLMVQIADEPSSVSGAGR
ncbi:NADP-dependent oxidoreductase [Mycolicibacterium fortuitum]|uniref:Alcohol dehydrogenase zinc-binding domain-containing protein n=1 Tax=Mycolicibacterium fortuitum subsp. fortuitum DSM 46621 = ATCC 6841 = JCM 6387 TaxID=1214102 RepID=K0UHE9_MYCFO|nr:NADP-dependent oxidoreductase [Mycolicibacterium fortuitum]CRL82821.1 NADP-dependent oxidoreductase [Mycolicibacter nonchromogenicus]EJZ06276.1 alcohol dehydrogenase zinc-binding domain-containing protein [Mycolicibacterium fortuitum subsp. fortuitum DSM 46621 = ATCC 6841 = JCM 6387]MBP3086592.1 NADP-dependent oxidoreductase [Mycolicibacterium fortuitum]WEV31595.1 NADP-dependent oxidoreductase [Mycolicibacterium fortuitum]CRL53045.1 NADP-dependent oxidoreductase [Mycolicibacterium fortuitum